MRVCLIGAAASQMRVLHPTHRGQIASAIIGMAAQRISLTEVLKVRRELRMLGLLLDHVSRTNDLPGIRCHALELTRRLKELFP